MLNIVAQTAATALTPEDSGTTVVLGGGVGTHAAQIQVINLPTILAAEVGTYYDFIVGLSANSGAAGSYTINAGGHASDLTGAATLDAASLALTGAVTVATGIQSTTVARTATDDGTGNGTIAAGTSTVLVDADSDANHIIILPPPVRGS